MVSVEDIILQLEFLICYVKVTLLERIKGRTHTHTDACAYTHPHALTQAHTNTQPAGRRANAERKENPGLSILRASWVNNFVS